MKRITIGEVQTAYDKTGMTPLCGRYSILASFVPCGCPQTALYLASDDAPQIDTVCGLQLTRDVRDWATAQYGWDYASWFRSFFDEPNLGFPIADNERQRQGRDDGRAIREALGSAVVTPPRPFTHTHLA